MPKSNTRRKLIDSVAIASKGKITTQVKFQENSDKSETNSTVDDKPRIISTKA